MESSSSKRQREEDRQAAIRKQIAMLQAQLDSSEGPDSSLPLSPKRKQPASGLIVPATPSPKKRRLSHNSVVDQRHSRVASSHMAQPIKRVLTPNLPRSQSSSLPKAPAPAPSAVLEKLARVHARQRSSSVEASVARSAAFTERPGSTIDTGDEGGSSATARDDRLALVEGLEPGPIDHQAPFDDPRFERIEPNSGIRLSSRTIPFDDFQEYLRGRYYLSPSKLYSVVRLLPNKQGYDVPVAGDWLTIAVVAERGKVKYSQAPVGLGPEDKLNEEDEENTIDQLPFGQDGTSKPNKQTKPAVKRTRKIETPRPSGKKYVNIKLVDFGCRARGPSTSGGKTVVRGDALLSLLLFEADGYDMVEEKNGKKGKIYKGGSRGAFEKLSMLREGAVVAFLNPRILKPFQRSADAPHPTDNILAITPESVSSIAVIGYCQDLGMCKAIKRDGSVCGSWCDKRVSDVCDWHVQYAVGRKRAGRAEFSTGTSGLSTGAKKKPAYDPANQWGLTPSEDKVGGNATYVVSGHIISGSNDTKALFISESLGRDAQARASRKVHNSDEALWELLKRDKEGSKALITARKHAKRTTAQIDKTASAAENSKRKLSSADVPSRDRTVDSDEESDHDAEQLHKHVYSAHLIKQLGFDPTAKDGKRSTDAQVLSKLDVLAAVQASRKTIRLGPRPGKRSSCVVKPETTAAQRISKVQDPARISDTDSADDLEREEFRVFGKSIQSSKEQTLVDLDSSDTELEVTAPS